MSREVAGVMERQGKATVVEVADPRKIYFDGDSLLMMPRKRIIIKRG